MPTPPPWDARNVPSGRLPRRARKPLGYTLIEVIAALTLLSLLATSSVTILAAATDASTQQVQSRQNRRDVQRLAESFRTDVSRAVELERGPTPWPITLEQEAGRVVYNWDKPNHTLTRELKKGSTRVQLDRYLIPETSNPHLLVSDKRVTLRIDLLGNRPAWFIQSSLRRPGT